MSIRATIATQTNENKILIIYVHHIDHPLRAADILVNNYKTTKQVEALLALGNLFRLGARIECPKDHSFENPISGYCISYKRDRKDGPNFLDVEEDFGPNEFENYPAALEEYCERTNFFWTGTQWLLDNNPLAFLK